MTKSETTLVYLTPDEALLFVEFQKRYHIIAQLVGCMESLNLSDIKNTSITMDTDEQGRVKHTAITKHYRI